MPRLYFGEEGATLAYSVIMTAEKDEVLIQVTPPGCQPTVGARLTLGAIATLAADLQSSVVAAKRVRDNAELQKLREESDRIGDQMDALAEKREEINDQIARIKRGDA